MTVRSETQDRQVVAFDGDRMIGEGGLTQVFPLVHDFVARGSARDPIVFDSTTSEVVELDVRGSLAEALSRSLATASPTRTITAAGDGATDGDLGAQGEASRGPGRPRLGVVAREVTLLPRHWDWLAAQPGGASAALRRLIEQARSASSGRDRTRRAQEYAYRFMSATLGNAPGFEEATRALFAGDSHRFNALSEPWPPDLRDHARRLALPAFTD